MSRISPVIIIGEAAAFPMARSSRKKLPLSLAPYKKAIPSSMSPVLKAPIRKYFSEASLLFKFRLSLPVSMYRGMEMISIPINNISRLLKELAMDIPQSTKKMSAKYSPGLFPMAAISLAVQQEIKQGAAKAIQLNSKPKASKYSMLWVSTGKK